MSNATEMITKEMKLTLRQVEVLSHLKECKVIGTGYDGSVLHSLCKKGLVVQHFNSGGGSAVYYTWTLSAVGETVLSREVSIR